MSTDFLVIKDLHVSLESNGTEIIKGLSLTVKQGEFHAIMGKNGSGKLLYPKFYLVIQLTKLPRVKFYLMVSHYWN